MIEAHYALRSPIIARGLNPNNRRPAKCPIERGDLSKMRPRPKNPLAILPDTLLIDPEAVRRKITSSTSAIIPVHLYGQLARLDEITEIADDHGLFVIEDGAQSHGSTRGGLTIGRSSTGAATSFFPGKNLGAFGDGGAVLTDSSKIADRLKALRNYGSPKKYSHPMIGFNSRLDSIQAAVLLAKLKYLSAWNHERCQIAKKYTDSLGGEVRLNLLSIDEQNEPVWHLFPVRTRERDHLLHFLHENRVMAGIHYPVPLHLQKAFSHLGNKPGDFPVAENAAASQLSLPIFPGMKNSQIHHVIKMVGSFLENRT